MRDLLRFATGAALGGALLYAVLPLPRADRPSGAAAWANIGGCGSSSGSVSSDLQLKWIGRGIPGPLLDAEITGSQSYLTDSAITPGKDFDGRLKLRSDAFVLSGFWHPPAFDFKVSLPLIMRQMNINANVINSGPLGDLSFELTRKWGEGAPWKTRVGLILPTGDHDVPLNASTYLLPEMQPGGGLLGASLGAEYSRDRDWGFWSSGAGYAFGLASNQTRSYAFEEGSAVPRDKGWGIAREGLGARNDIGTLQPDYLSFFFDLAIRQEGLVHGLSFAYGQPMRDGEYEERPSAPTAWSGTDTAAIQYFPTKARAQEHADTVMLDGARVYGDPTVLGMDGLGRWVVMDRISIERSAFPSLTTQYSIEKSDMAVPLLFGGALRWDFDGGMRLAGFGIGLGLKFGVY